jgi:predicted amidohydrolase
MAPSTSARRFNIAAAQLPITGDARQNGAQVRAAMREAAAGRAQLIHFPEGMLSGYAKHPILDWAEVDFGVVRQELEAVMALAADLGLWVVLGSAHPLTPPRWPHNSLYVISAEGQVVTRYDKRIPSHTEITRFYTPGTQAVVFDVNGFRFGCVICVEINFPALFIEYEALGVDCLLLSAYPVDTIFVTKARAYAAVHTCWISLSAPTETAHLMMSGLISPGGELLGQIGTPQGVVFNTLNRDDPALEIPLCYARPWRARARTDPEYNVRQIDDARSSDRTGL